MVTERLVPSANLCTDESLGGTSVAVRVSGAAEPDLADKLILDLDERCQVKKVGIIRCQQTEDMCPGTTDFKIASQGKLAFEKTGPVEIVGFVSCGGCPGKRAIARVKQMIDRGAQTIVFASCISKGNPISFPCPHFALMKDAIIKAIGPGIEIIEYTH
jgi:predicted metal-binding protein